MSLENEHLTTDAVPGAPRQNISPILEKKTFEKDEEEPKFSKPEINKNNKEIQDAPPYRKKKTSSSSSKPKKAPPRNMNGAPQVFVVNSRQVHVGAVNNYNLYTNSSSTSKTEKGKYTATQTEDVDCVLNAKNVLVTPEHINVISTHLGEGWRDVGSELGYSWGQMDHFYEDSKTLGHKEVVYQMLLDWTRMKTDEATLAKLTRTLWHTGQKDVVQRLADSLK